MTKGHKAHLWRHYMGTWMICVRCGIVRLGSSLPTEEERKR